MRWTLSIDFGTTATVAAILEPDGRADLVEFGTTTRMPSGVFLDSADGLVAGQHAANRSGADPARYVRTPKRHVGVDDSVLVSGTQIEVADLVAAVLGGAAKVAIKRAGGRPERTVLTHPARWASRATEQLLEAARRAGLGEVELVPEPVAAGWAGASRDSEGALIAVYDLGGGTFDAAVLRRENGAWVLAGKPGGLVAVGGERFDALLHEHLIGMLRGIAPEAAKALSEPATRAERGHARTWWRDVRTLKEQLSDHSAGDIAVPGTDHSLQVTRDELEDLVAKDLDGTIGELLSTLSLSDVEPSELDEVVVSGDASQMPAVGNRLNAAFSVPISMARDPKAVVAQGAIAAADQLKMQPSRSQDAADAPDVPVVPEMPPLRTPEEGLPAGTRSDPDLAESDTPRLPTLRQDEAAGTRRSRHALALIASAAVLAIGGAAAIFALTGSDDQGTSGTGIDTTTGYDTTTGDTTAGDTTAGDTTAGDTTAGDDTTTSSFASPEDEALYYRIPATDCESDWSSVDENAYYPDEVYAAINCSVPVGGVDGVQYWEFYDDVGMDAEYEAHLEYWGLSFDDGDCASDSYAENVWSDDDGDGDGRVACWLRENDGYAVMMWTTNRDSVLSFGWSTSGNEAALYDWWASDNAGP